MRFKRTILCVLVLLSALGSPAQGPIGSEPLAAPPERTSSSLALSPAVVEVKTQPGASSAHEMTITNLTQAKFKFVLEAYDVVIRDGKRAFVPSGETEGGIARSAIFDPPTIELNPGEAGHVKVTLTVPEQPRVRAVAAIFHGQTALPGNGAFMMTGSLGTLITYNLSQNVSVHIGTPIISSQTENSNLAISDELRNEGSEPIIANGTLAILKTSGELVGRVAIEPRRLLPGEKIDCQAEYPRSLPPGDYRAMLSLENEAGVQTRSVQFRVP